MHNIHISYDLNKAGKDYTNLIAKIKNLGNWVKIHKSYWYVNSTLSASQIAEILWVVMDSDDSLYVVNSTNNSASWRNLSQEAQEYIKKQWNTSLVPA